MADYRLVDIEQLEGDLTSVADKIRERSGGTADLAFPEGFISEVDNVSSGNSLEDYWTYSISTFSSDTLTALPEKAFGGSQTDVSKRFNNLTSVNLPNVTVIGNQAFFCCTNLASVNLPNVTVIGDEAFSACLKIKTLNIPKVEEIGRCGLSGNTQFKEPLILPCLKKIKYRGLATFTLVQKIDLAIIESIGFGAFLNCQNLTTLIIRSQNMCALLSAEEGDIATMDWFTNTPIQKGTGYIYVPSSFVDAYKEDSAWSPYADQIRAIEDYPEITGG